MSVSESQILCIFAVGVRAQSACVYARIRMITYARKDPVVYVRVRWITETRNSMHFTDKKDKHVNVNSREMICT